MRRHVRQVRPGPGAEPEVRFETPPGHQGQVDFTEFRLPWGSGRRVVVLGYSRLLWVRYYERQTLPVLVRGVEAAFRYFGTVPQELLFDQMKAVVIKDGRERGGWLVTSPEFRSFSRLRRWPRPFPLLSGSCRTRGLAYRHAERRIRLQRNLLVQPREPRRVGPGESRPIHSLVPRGPGHRHRGSVTPTAPTIHTADPNGIRSRSGPS